MKAHNTKINATAIRQFLKKEFSITEKELFDLRFTDMDRYLKIISGTLKKFSNCWFELGMVMTEDPVQPNCTFPIGGEVELYVALSSVDDLILDMKELIIAKEVYVMKRQRIMELQEIQKQKEKEKGMGLER